MSATFLTIVVRNPTPEEVYDLTHHDKISAASWSHAMDERDELKWRLQKLLDEKKLRSTYERRTQTLD